MVNNTVHRAFLSLYILIVASVILVGLGFDALLAFYDSDSSVGPSDRDLFTVLEQQVQTDISQGKPLLSNNSQLHSYLLSDFANTQMADRLRAGEIVVVHSDQGTRQLFKLVPESVQVLAVTQTVNERTSSNIYNTLVVVFYLLIAGVVFLWVWPLSRDLRKLESQTRLIGQDHLAEPLDIGQTSPVYDVAASFNRMSERVKALLASHKEMTYAVSHELRTPLARMKFALAMAQNSSDSSKLQKQLLGVKEDVAEMDDLVNQLLAYAGFEQGSQVLDQQPGDMGYLITQLIERVKASVPGTEVVFQFENHLAEHELIFCEWHLLERAIHNLLQNAERYAQNKAVVKLDCDRKNYLISVEDDGTGVAMEDRERVFQSFVRIANHTNAKSRGFGLGLAIVKRVMNWHKGDADVGESLLGGAKFTIWWPKPETKLN